MKTMLTAINAKYIHSNPAIYSLKACSGIHKKDIILGEYTINNLGDDIIRDIYEKKPDFIGFSTYIWNVEYVMRIACELRKLLPETHIWLGGPEVTYNAKEVLQKNAFLDGVMCGEGEETFRELLDCFEVVKSKEKQLDEKLQDIAGITYRRRDGEIVETGARKPLDMTALPFLYEDYFKEKSAQDFENRIIYYESSRGCPFSCSYCLSSVEKSLRFRDIELVKKELSIFIANKVKQVKFIDRTFNCKKSHAMAILRYIGENDNGITNFHFEIAADLLDDEEIALIKTFRPGLIQLEIGIQSTNVQTINEIHRNMDLEKVAEVVRKINEGKNVMQHLDVIAGLPYEDLQSFIKSFNDVYHMKPTELQLGFLKVLTGSLMHEDAGKYGIVYREYPPYEVLYTDFISYEEISELKGVEEALEVYYNSGQYPNSMKYLEIYYAEKNNANTPYHIYKDIWEYYKRLPNEGSLSVGRKYSRQDRYSILYDFFCEKEKDSKKIQEFSQILTFDIYLRECAKKRPDFAKDWDEIKIEIHKRYQEKEGRTGLYHVEIFDIDVIKFQETGKLEWKTTTVGFDYQKRNNIWNYAQVEEL